MIVIILLQLVIVTSMVVASRRRVEDALPVFCFFLVLMPLESKLPIPGLFDFNTMRLLLVTLLALYLIKGKPSSKEPIPLKGLMFLHIAWALCSTVYSLSVATSFKQLLSQVLEFYLMYFLLVKIISSVETIHKILYAMMMAIAVCCIFSLFEAYASWSVLRIFPSSNWITYNGGRDPLYTELGRGFRARSTFPHPILFGDALAMSIPIALYMLGTWVRGKQRLFLWLGLMLMLWAIYKTQSRGPWLATGLCTMFLLFMIKGKVRKYLVVLSVLAMIVMLARPGIWQSIGALFEASTDPTQPVGSSYLYRHVLMETITNTVQKDPSRALLGYGLGTFRELGLEITFLGVTKRWYTCDNNWAVFLYETGYVGLIIIGILLFKALFIALRGYRKLPRPDNALSGVIFISLAGFYFLMLSVAGYSWGQQGYMSWMLISLAVSLPRVVHLNEEAEPLELVQNEDQIEMPHSLYVA